MLQIWSLVRGVSPVEAYHTGDDRSICFDCPIHDACYVTLIHGPNPIWHAYQRGSYPPLQPSQYTEVFGGRKVRFGAYGESVLLPLSKLRAIVAVCAGHTGYTHQWRNPRYQAYAQYIMASCETALGEIQAERAGWRAFRVRSFDQPLLPSEVICPASREAGYRTTCDRCTLCNGRTADDRRKHVAIYPHGGRSNKLVTIMAAL